MTLNKSNMHNTDTAGKGLCSPEKYYSTSGL